VRISNNKKRTDLLEHKQLLEQRETDNHERKVASSILVLQRACRRKIGFIFYVRRIKEVEGAIAVQKVYRM
jgi:hypothetical protein